MFNFLKNLFNWNKKNENESIIIDTLIPEEETKVQEPQTSLGEVSTQDETNSTILELAKTIPPEKLFTTKVTSLVENSEPQVSEAKTEKKKNKRKYYPKKKTSEPKKEVPKDTPKDSVKPTKSRKKKSE